MTDYYILGFGNKSRFNPDTRPLDELIDSYIPDIAIQKIDTHQTIEPVILPVERPEFNLDLDIHTVIGLEDYDEYRLMTAVLGAYGGVCWGKLFDETVEFVSLYERNYWNGKKGCLDIMITPDGWFADYSEGDAATDMFAANVSRAYTAKQFCDKNSITPELIAKTEAWINSRGKK
jgi:hypothetical protein